MQKPLPTVVQAFHDLLQHEQKLKADGKGSGNKATTQSVALAAGSYSGNGSSNSNSTTKNPYKGNGGGETGTYKGSGSGETDQLFCNYCKKTNHVIKDCWRLKKKRQEREGSGNRFSSAVAQDADVEGDRNSQVEVGIRFSNTTGGFTAEEMNKLRTLLQSSSSSSPTSPQSPAINHRSHSVTNYLPQFPSYAGPSDQQENWFGKRT
ncbi:unnamed protein product [Linum trigynum]